FISGNAGTGRRAIAHTFYEAQYPHVGKIFPSINIDSYSGFEEIYRKILTELRPTMSVTELKTRAHAFQIASDSEKPRQIAQLMNSLLPAGEAAFLIDTGGMLTDAGALETEIDQI